MVAQRDFKFHFPSVGIDALIVGLLVLGDDVEGVADVDVHVLVLGGVIDAVFTGEENPAF